MAKDGTNQNGTNSQEKTITALVAAEQIIAAVKEVQATSMGDGYVSETTWMKAMQQTSIPVYGS